MKITDATPILNFFLDYVMVCALRRRRKLQIENEAKRGLNESNQSMILLSL